MTDLALTPDLHQRFVALLGEAHVITAPDAMARYLGEPRGRVAGRAPAVLRPGSTDDVAHLVALCARNGVAVTPQGGNTGRVAGQTPLGDSVVISLERMNRIRSIDPQDNALTAEAGTILATIQNAAAQADRLFPLSLGAEGSCQIGGNLAANAGGINVLRYGMARDLVLGLEVVLADGRIWDGLKTLRKDNTGYDLKQFFLGAEGTLGLITAASLKLFPRPKDRATAMVAVADVARAVDLLHLAQDRSGGQVSAFEFMGAFPVALAVRHGEDLRHPFPDSPAPWFVLMDLESGRPGSLAPVLETLLEPALETGLILDAVPAASEAQAQQFWAIRHHIPEAQTREGASIKHDVSVPVSKVAAFIAQADAAAGRLCPGIRPCPFGHLGDGNVHYNLSQPEDMDRHAFLDQWDRLSAEVHAIAARLGGSISAEHGIGAMKRAALPHFKSDVDMDLMRRIKHALDPAGLMNPGKVL